MVAQLRQFLYLDRRLMREFLAQLEGGLYDQHLQHDVSGSHNKGAGSVALRFAKADLGQERDETESAEFTVVQTDASEFERFHGHLVGSSLVTTIESLDDDGWQRLRRGDVIEIDAQIDQSGMSTLRDLTRAGASYVELAAAFGQEVEPDTSSDNPIPDGGRHILKRSTRDQAHVSQPRSTPSAPRESSQPQSTRGCPDSVCTA